jgi:hypothetical protein
MPEDEDDIIEYEHAVLTVGVEYPPQLVTISFAKGANNEEVLSVAYLAIEQVPSFVMALYEAVKELTEENDNERTETISLPAGSFVCSRELSLFASRN